MSKGSASFESTPFANLYPLSEGVAILISFSYTSSASENSSSFFNSL